MDIDQPINETEKQKDKILSAEASPIKLLKFKSCSALKALVADFLMTKQVSDCISNPINLGKSPLILEIYETFPLLLCHDGYFFINVSFEQEAW